MLAEIRLSGELEDEYDSAGHNIPDEEILAEFMEIPESIGQATRAPLASSVAPGFLGLSMGWPIFFSYLR